jgi:hypothetical protein
MKTILATALALQILSVPVLAQTAPNSVSRLQTSSRAQAPSLRSEGGAVPGGGGYVKVNGRAQTLAEAGLIFDRFQRLPSKKYPEIYDVREETKRELGRILGSLPLPPGTKMHSGYILGSRDTFIKQDGLTPAENATLQADYKRAIKKLGGDLGRIALIFAAYAKDIKTNILPAFDDLAKEEDGFTKQALILIHEFWMRQPIVDKAGKPLSMAAKLERVLRLDAAIHRILTRGSSDELKLRLAEVLLDLGDSVKGTVYELRFKELETKLGRPVREDELFLSFHSSVYNPNIGSISESFGGEVNPSLVQRFESVAPGIADGLNGAVFTDYDIGFGSEGFCQIIENATTRKESDPFEMMWRMARESNLQLSLERYPGPLSRLLTQTPSLCPQVTANLAASCEKAMSPGKANEYKSILTYEPSTEIVFDITCHRGESGMSYFVAKPGLFK